MFGLSFIVSRIVHFYLDVRDWVDYLLFERMNVFDLSDGVLGFLYFVLLSIFSVSALIFAYNILGIRNFWPFIIVMSVSLVVMDAINKR